MTKVKQIFAMALRGCQQEENRPACRRYPQYCKYYIQKFNAMNRPVEELLAKPDKDLEEMFAANPMH
jgi:hypothetical protein